MTSLAFEAILLGLVFCATPGVITTEALRRGLARGFRAALLLQLGSVVGDTVWAVIALCGGAFLVRANGAREAIGLVGGALLLYLAASAFHDAAARVRGSGQAETDATQISTRGDFAVGAALSLGNPFAVAFWLGIGTGVVSTKIATPGLLPFGIFLGGIAAGGVAWSAAFAAAVALGRRHLTPLFFALADAGCGAALAWFGVDLLRRTWG